PSCSIYYASSSVELATQVQHLLLSVGIQSSLRVQPQKKNYRLMHHVYVEGTPNQSLFLKNVGCAGERGKKIPLFLENLSQIQPNPNTDIIPKEAWKLFVDPAKTKARLGWREVCTGLNTAYCGSTLFKSGISRNRLSTLCNFLKNESLNRLAQSDI